MSRRIVITGYGALTACGQDIGSTWESVRSGHSGIRPIQRWDVSEWEYALGAEIAGKPLSALLPDRKLLKLLSRHDVFGLNALSQAVEHSQWLSHREEPDPSWSERTGVYVACGGSKYEQQYEHLPLLSKVSGELHEYGSLLLDEVHPTWLLRILPNNVLAYAGIHYGFKGPNQNISNHGVSSIQVILEAASAIREGEADRAVVIGYDMALEMQAQMNYAMLGTLSQKGLFPFHAHHDGTILGEGAGALVLETLEEAQQRGAKIHAEILGGSVLGEGLGVFRIHSSGEGMATSIAQTLAKSHRTADEIGLVVAHGNGSPQSDVSEALGIASVLGSKVPVTGFKWATGHTIAAAGAIETGLAITAMQHGCVPGIANLDHISDACVQMSVSQKHRLLEKDCALILNRGLGGLNASLCLTRTIA